MQAASHPFVSDKWHVRLIVGGVSLTACCVIVPIFMARTCPILRYARLVRLHTLSGFLSLFHHVQWPHTVLDALIRDTPLHSLIPTTYHKAVIKASCKALNVSQSWIAMCELIRSLNPKKKFNVHVQDRQSDPYVLMRMECKAAYAAYEALCLILPCRTKTETSPGLCHCPSKV